MSLNFKKEIAFGFVKSSFYNEEKRTCRLVIEVIQGHQVPSVGTRVVVDDKLEKHSCDDDYKWQSQILQSSAIRQNNSPSATRPAHHCQPDPVYGPKIPCSHDSHKKDIPPPPPPPSTDYGVKVDMGFGFDASGFFKRIFRKIFKKKERL